MNEEVASKTVNLAVRTMKVTANILYKALRIYVQNLKRKQTVQDRKNAPKRGKQSVKDLIGQGQGVESMEITDQGIKDFKRIANKFGVDFAIVRDKNSNPPVYTVFFKAKDVDAITAILKEYSARQMMKKRHAEKPSILKKLKKFKDMVKQASRKDKEKHKDRVR